MMDFISIFENLICQHENDVAEFKIVLKALSLRV